MNPNVGHFSPALRQQLRKAGPTEFQGSIIPNSCNNPRNNPDSCDFPLVIIKFVVNNLQHPFRPNVVNTFVTLSLNSPNDLHSLTCLTVQTLRGRQKRSR